MAKERILVLSCDGEEEVVVSINPEPGIELVLSGAASGEINSGKECDEEYAKCISSL